jgi:phosphoserine phosphatase
MSRNLALFDLDHTLLPLDSDQAWAHFIAGLGIEGAAQHAEEIDDYYRQYVAGTLDMTAYLNYTLAPLARHSREQLDTWHAQFMEDVIAPAILPAARELVQRHIEAGDLCCIVTATNVFITKPIGKALGFEHLLGIDLGTEGGDPLARFTGTAVGVPTFREGKITRTENWLASLGHRLIVCRIFRRAGSIAIRSTTCLCSSASRIRSRPIPTRACAPLPRSAVGR